MGTNYYVTTEIPCGHCGRGGEMKHIGKSSAGWCFALHVYPDENINTLEDWMELWKNKTILDEYGSGVSNDDMLSIITQRGRKPKWHKKPYMYDSWDEFHRLNYSQEGPNGLLRSIINAHCVGHGEGTYDYIIGDFS